MALQNVQVSKCEYTCTCICSGGFLSYPVYYLIIIYPEYVQNQGQVGKDQCHDQVSHPDLVHFFKISICYLIMTKNIHC